MKFKRGNKKGFTIVELVIVIAVIAILASVLIPTFSNMIKKAKRAADTQLVRTINGYVQTDLATKEEDKHSSMHEAILGSRKYGLSPDALTTRSDYSLAWDSQTGLFVLLETGSTSTKVVYPTSDEGTSEYEIDLTNKPESEKKAIDFFIVTEYKKYSLNTPYSTYAYGEGWPAEVTACTGFDTGAVTSITRVNYINKSSNAQNVIIRTNTFKTRLSVDSPLDTVSHYGFAGMVNVITNKTYNEYGTVGRLTMTDDNATGAVAVKFGGAIYQIEQNNDNEKTSVSIAYNSSVFDINGEELAETNNNKTVCSDKVVLGENGCKHDVGTGNVRDGFETYEVCKRCGYTLVTLNNTMKVTVRDENENVITPMISYFASNTDEVKKDSPLGDILIDDKLFETIPEVVSGDGDDITQYCSGNQHNEVYTASGKDADGYYIHTITCTNEALNGTTTCAYNTKQHCDLGNDNKCVKCGQTFESGFGYSYDNKQIVINFIKEDTTAQGSKVLVGIEVSTESELTKDSLEHIIIPDTITEVKFEHADENQYVGQVNTASPFYNCKSLKSIVIPASVTSMSALKVVQQSGSHAKDIGCFEGCTSLTSVTFLTDEDGNCGMTSTGRAMFKDCTSLTSITLPNSIKKIDENTFKGCTSLKEITFADDLTEICNYAFSGCTNLETIIFPATLTKISGTRAFENCKKLEVVDLSNCTELTTIGMSNTFVRCDSLKYVNLSNTLIQEIPAACFENCRELLKVDLPTTLTKIGDYAFDYCYSLSKIEIKSNVTMNYSGFRGCDLLYDITDLRSNITNNNAVYVSDNNYFKQNTAYLDIKYSTSTTSKIIYSSDGNWQFYDDGENTPRLIRYIGISDKDITLPTYDEAYIIDKDAFKYRTITGTLTIPAAANFTLDGDPFMLQSSNDYEYYYALKDVEEIIADGSNPNYTIYNGILYNNDKTEIVFAPKLSSLIIPNTITNIPAKFLENNYNLTSVVFEQGQNQVTFGAKAFYNCSNLTNVVLPQNYVYASDAFARTKITTINIGNVTSFNVLSYTKLQYITCDSNNTMYSSVNGCLYSKDGTELSVIPYCYSNGSSNVVTISADVTKIADIDNICKYANFKFSVDANNQAYSSDSNGCLYNKNMETLYYVPKSLTNNFAIPNTVKEIYKFAFYNCTGLISVTIPSGVTKIGNYAFAKCTSLTVVTIPSSVTNIGVKSFQYCENLNIIIQLDQNTLITKESTFVDVYSVNILITDESKISTLMPYYNDISVPNVYLNGVIQDKSK